MKELLLNVQNVGNELLPFTFFLAVCQRREDHMFWVYIRAD